MIQFAKTFEVSNRQVLVFMEPDETRDYVMHQMTYSTRLGAMVDIKVTFDLTKNLPIDFEPYASCLDLYSEEKAQRFMAEVHELEGAGV